MNDKLPPSLNRFAAELEEAIRRELTPRRDHRLSRVLRPRPRLLAGTTIGAAGTGAVLALVLTAAGTSPAFAVTPNHDGTYSVTLRSLRAIPAANRRLAGMGVPARFVQAASCNFQTTSLAKGARPDIRVKPTTMRRGRTMVIAAWRQKSQVKIASAPVTRSVPAGCVPPPCSPPPGRAATVTLPQGNFQQVPVAGNSGKSGNSGNSGSAGSGHSGNSGSSGSGKSGNSGGFTIQCPAPPPPGAGNSGNSGNSGSGSSGNS